MKIFGEIKPACHHHLLTFDKTKHPLLHEVWQALRNHNHGLNDHEIFEKYCGEKRPTKTYNTHLLNLDILEDPFVVIEKPVCDEYGYEEDYEFEIFLEDIYNIETFVNGHPDRLDVALQDIERQAILDAISQLPDIDEISALKASLAENVEYLGKYYREIGVFEIIPDKNERHKRDTFKDFISFRVELLKLTNFALNQGNRPSFRFGFTWYDHLITQTRQVVSNIASFLATSTIPTKNIGHLLQDVYYLAHNFAFSHSEPFSSIIHKGQQGILEDKSRGVTGSQTRLEKTKDQRKNYLQL